LRDNNGIVFLNISDDGRGFDPDTVRRGHGLNNMAARARRSDGTLQIISIPGRGTTITVQFQKPL